MATTATARLLALVVVAASLAAGAAALRSLGVRDGAGAGAADGDAAVDLNATNFDAFLKASQESFAVVEFFAHWCPACRNYKPHYEKVAKLFNGPDAAHPGIILMARVDCASKVNIDLCNRFSVDHYPFLLWGPPTKFASTKWDPKQEKSEIKLIGDGKTAERLLKWINKQMESSFSLDDKKYENESMLPKNASDPEQIVRAIYDVEEATAHALQIIFEHKMIKPETRDSLIRFSQILVAHHPSKRCRRGSAELLINFDDHWPSNLSLSSQESYILLESVAAENHWICGKEVPRGYWMFCRGSKSETRGFSCGLWVLLHSLTVRIGDGESQSTFTSICDFIHNFFICEECRKHFYEMCSSVSVPFKSARDLSLWLWSTHNKVNERLMKEEKDLGTGDSSFPKVIWPQKQLCPSCYRSSSGDGAVQVDWNEDEVFQFLVNYYGKMLIIILQGDLHGVSSSREDANRVNFRRFLLFQCRNSPNWSCPGCCHCQLYIWGTGLLLESPAEEQKVLRPFTLFKENMIKHFGLVGYHCYCVLFKENKIKHFGLVGYHCYCVLTWNSYHREVIRFYLWILQAKKEQELKNSPPVAHPALHQRGPP